MSQPPSLVDGVNFNATTSIPATATATTVDNNANAAASYWDWNSWSEWGSSVIDSVDQFFSQENIDYALSTLQDLFTPVVELDESKDAKQIQH